MAPQQQQQQQNMSVEHTSVSRRVVFFKDVKMIFYECPS
jgi:hypothetical protein